MSSCFSLFLSLSRSLSPALSLSDCHLIKQSCAGDTVEIQCLQRRRYQTMATKRRKPRSRRNLGRRIGCAHNGCANVQGTKSSWKFCRTNGTAKLTAFAAGRPLMSFVARARVLLRVCISLLLVASAKAWSLSALPHARAGSARSDAASARAAIMDFSSQHGPAPSAQAALQEQILKSPIHSDLTLF